MDINFEIISKFWNDFSFISRYLRQILLMLLFLLNLVNKSKFSPSKFFGIISLISLIFCPLKNIFKRNNLNVFMNTKKSQENNKIFGWLNFWSFSKWDCEKEILRPYLSTKFVKSFRIGKEKLSKREKVTSSRIEIHKLSFFFSVLCISSNKNRYTHPLIKVSLIIFGWKLKKQQNINKLY